MLLLGDFLRLVKDGSQNVRDNNAAWVAGPGRICFLAVGCQLSALSYSPLERLAGFLSIYSWIINQLFRVGVPPLPPRSSGIMELGGNSRQVFGFKGLTAKVFENQQVRLSNSAESGFGAISGAVLMTDLETAPIRSLSLRAVGLKSMDFDHEWLR